MRYKRILWGLAVFGLVFVGAQALLALGRALLPAETASSADAAQTGQNSSPGTGYSVPTSQYSPGTQFSGRGSEYSALTAPPAAPRAPFVENGPPPGRAAAGRGRAKVDEDPSRPTGCFVTMKTIEIPAQEAGQIKEFKAEEGQEVTEKTLLAVIDDSQAQMNKKIQYWKLKAAEEEAKNEVSVRYAEAGLKMAKIEHEMNQAANKVQVGAVSALELVRSQFKIDEQTLAVEEARHKLTVAKVTADEKRAELDAADMEIRRREIRSPCFGRIEKRVKELGEWVKPGDLVFQILKTDVAYVKGHMDALQLTPADVEGRPVRASVSVKGRPEVFEGTVIVAEMKVDETGRCIVTAEVKNRKQNGQWLLRDGMGAEMTIDLRK